MASGALAATPGVGPATLRVLEELVASGESRYLERLRAETPESLAAMLRIPNVTAAQVHAFHEALGVSSPEELEAAARDGRLTTVKGIGPRTVQRILDGIAMMRATGAQRRYPDARDEALQVLAQLRSRTDVAHAVVAGAVRRFREVASEVEIVAAVHDGVAPGELADRHASAPGIRTATRTGDASVRVAYADGWCVHMHFTTRAGFPVALWRATGTPEHVARVTDALASRGLRVDGDVVLDATGTPVDVPDEAALYRLASLAAVPPELRESGIEVDVAAGNALPALIEDGDVRGVLHCHTTWSDGKATVRAMALAAQARGWSYLAITDHSQLASYAGGLSPDAVLEQHAEIAMVDAELAPQGFRVLKGIEADIHADGQIDYEPSLLARFDVVVGSVHSRFRMNEREMTDRVLAALDSPYLTVLGHPTGRLLLSRAPYAIDVDAVLQRAAERGVAVEINADPHRLDLDWRHVRRALELGVTLAIGPDAHSTRALDNVAYGVGMARKGWATAADVLNARPVEDVLAFARRRAGDLGT